MPSDTDASAVQLLLCLCDVIGVARDQRYLALWHFADQFIPSLNGQQQNKLDSLLECDTSPSKLLAAACLLLVLQQVQPTGEHRGSHQEAAEQYHAQMCLALQDDVSLDKLAAAVKVMEGIVDIGQCQDLTSDHLTRMHGVISNSGLAYFEPVKIEVCYSILDLLYASEGYRASKPLECGGKLLAAAIIGAACALAVPPEQVVSLPLLSWLCDLSACPKEVIRTQTEQVLTYVLQ